jgi:tripeptidyl-peptidase-1
MHFQPAAIAALLLTALCDAKAMMRKMDSVQRTVLAESGWADASTIEAKKELTLQIGLTLQNTNQMITKLLDVSNPKSKNYAKWLDRDAVNKIVQPSATANKAVLDWLTAENVTKVYSDGTWITFKTDVETANRILDADFREYSREGVDKIRTTEYSVPQSVFDHIDIIHPTTFFGRTEAFAPSYYPASQNWENLIPRQVPDDTVPDNAPTGVNEGAPAGTTSGKGPFPVSADCQRGITPACIRQMYNIGDYQVSAGTKSKMAFSSFLNQSANYQE